MHLRGSCLALLTAALGLAVPTLASADTTLGNVTLPAGSSAVPCDAPPPNLLYITSGGGGFDSAYTVPAGGPYAVSKWSIGTDGAKAGDQATFVVTRLVVSPAPSLTVVGADTETLTAGSLPAGNVQTFSLPSPIPVNTGDLISLYVPGSTTPGYACGWTDGAVPSSDNSEGFPLTSPPVAGQAILPSGGAGGFTGELNIGATLSPLTYDAGLSMSSGPSNAIAGQPAVVTATVTNNGPLAGQITFTDPVPSALHVVAAATDSGSCATSSVNIVTCTTSSVPVGHSAKVVIVVAPSTAGTFSNPASVADAGGATDPNSANDDASTTLNVVANNGPTQCVVPKLSRSSVALAKKILPLLGCTVGKTQKSHSKTVAKGLLIGSSPGAGTYAVNTAIALKVSSGPPPKKKHKKKK